MITWSESLSTSHENIDAEHKMLIKSLNDLDQAMKKGAGRDQITASVLFLENYVAGHFAREEAYMLKVKCPSFADNCKAHRELKQKLANWKNLLTKEGASTTLVLEIYNETSDWITNHILKIDCKLKGCKAAV